VQSTSLSLFSRAVRPHATNFFSFTARLMYEEMQDKPDYTIMFTHAYTPTLTHTRCDALGKQK